MMENRQFDEGFGVMTIDGKAPVTSATFRADDANDATLTSLLLVQKH